MLCYETQILAPWLHSPGFRFKFLPRLVEVEFLVAEDEGMTLLYQYTGYGIFGKVEDVYRMAHRSTPLEVKTSCRMPSRWV
jgi:hypothetical protein